MPVRAACAALLVAPSLPLYQNSPSELSLPDRLRGSWLLHLSPPSPQVASLLSKTAFPFYQHLPLEYWLSSDEQPDLSSVTLPNLLLP